MGFFFVEDRKAPPHDNVLTWVGWVRAWDGGLWLRFAFRKSCPQYVHSSSPSPSFLSPLPSPLPQCSLTIIIIICFLRYSIYPKAANFAYAESIGRSLVLRPHPDVYASESSYHPFLYIPILPRMDHSCNLCRHCALMNSSFSRRHFVSMCRTFGHHALLARFQETTRCPCVTLLCPLCVIVSASILSIVLFSSSLNQPLTNMSSACHTEWACMNAN